MGNQNSNFVPQIYFIIMGFSRKFRIFAIFANIFRQFLTAKTWRTIPVFFPAMTSLRG